MKGLKNNTRDSYNTYFTYWEQFCDWMSLDLLSINQQNALDFVAWCFEYTSLNSELVDKALTATVSFHKDNGISFDRKQYPSIKRHLDGFRVYRPPQRRKKLPWSEYHIQRTFQHCINTTSYNDVLIGTCMLLCYSLLLRPGEATFNSKAPLKKLLNNRLTWHPSFADATELSIQVIASKTNRWGHKLETIYTSCNCDDTIRNIPCPIHLTKHWISMRNKYHNTPFKDEDFLFIHKNKNPLMYDQLNTWMHNVINRLNTILSLNMNPAHYTPHTLRLGGCTDWARRGEPSWRIEMQGRWSSKIWRYTYINMDWKDMARLKGCTVSELLKEIKHQPYE